MLLCEIYFILTWSLSSILIFFYCSYLRGEGCGAILLMPTNTAKSGSVYANVLGASVMSDEKSASITAPNGSAQERLIKKALEVSGIMPSDVDCIEAHKTGTAPGNSIVIALR